MGIVGVIPCAGKSERIFGLPKYLLPVEHPQRYLLAVLVERMRIGGAEEILIAASPENRAIVEKFAPAGCTLISVETNTMSETMLSCRRFCGEDTVLFGMPDSYWADDRVYYKLGVDEDYPIMAVCWSVNPEQRKKLGMVQVVRGEIGNHIPATPANFIRQVLDKPQGETDLNWAWGALVWHPRFWHYLCAEDAHVGYAMQRAMAAGIPVRAVLKNGDSYFDCGTFDEYRRMLNYPHPLAPSPASEARGNQNE